MEPEELVLAIDRIRWLIDHHRARLWLLERTRTSDEAPPPHEMAAIEASALSTMRHRNLAIGGAGWIARLIETGGRFGFAFCIPSGRAWFRLSQRGFEWVPSPEVPWQKWDCEASDPLTALAMLAETAELLRLDALLANHGYRNVFERDRANSFWFDGLDPDSAAASELLADTCGWQHPEFA
jgi:hypothetical protein